MFWEHTNQETLASYSLLSRVWDNALDWLAQPELYRPALAPCTSRCTCDGSSRAIVSMVGQDQAWRRLPSLAYGTSVFIPLGSWRTRIDGGIEFFSALHRSVNLLPALSS